MSKKKVEAIEPILTPKRLVLADRLAEIARYRSERLAPLLKAVEQADEIVRGHEDALQQFDGLDEEIHSFHQAQIERQVMSGEAPSLLLPQDLRAKRESRETAQGNLTEAHVYRDRARAERAKAEAEIEAYKPVVMEAVIEVLQEEALDRVKVFDEARKTLEQCWAEILGILNVRVPIWQFGAWRNDTLPAPPEALGIQLSTPGLSGLPLTPQAMHRIVRVQSAYEKLVEKLYRDANARPEFN